MPFRSSTTTFLAAAVIAALVATAVPVAATTAPTSTPASTGLGAISGGRLHAGQEVLGQAPSALPIAGELALAPRDPSGLAVAAAAASTPGNASYHHFLAPGAFRDAWGPSAATRDAAIRSLTAAGLQASSSANGLIISFHGAASQVSSAFHARLSAVRTPSGRLSVAASTPLALPSGVATRALGVFGLGVSTSLSPMLQRGHSTYAPAAAAPATSSGSPTSGPQACGAARKTAVAYDGQTDDQIASRYGASTLFGRGSLGQGQRVAIFELEPFAMKDIEAFVRCYLGDDGVARLADRLSVHNVDGGQPSGPGVGESALDIENIAALAPQAGIDVYQAPNTTDGALLEYNQIVQDDADKVISSSWGLCESVALSAEPGAMQLENVIFEQAALQGQTMFASAGDAGSSDCQPSSPGLAVDDPAAQPYVVSVGGTTIQSPQGVERVWDDGASWGGGGGGISQVWAAPSWQAVALRSQGFQQPSTAQSVGQRQGTANGGAFCRANLSSLQVDACRGVPDVSANADEFTGAITVYENGWTTIGGTSSAAPIWAALMADAASTPTCQSQPFGFLSPSLYAVGTGPQAATSFHDIQDGSTDVFGENSGLYAAGPGYDLASGLGTPKVDGLAGALCTASPSAPVITSLSPPQIDAAGSASVTVQGANFTANMVAQVGTVHVDVPTPASSTSFTITVPAASLQGPAGTGTDPAGANPLGPGRYQVLVTSSAGTSTPSAASILDLAVTSAGSALPVVSGVLPSGGTEDGGQQVTLMGDDFAAGDAVTFGGVPSPQVTVAGATQLTATVPAYAPGSTTCAPTGTDPTTDVCQVSVVVTGPDGASIPAAIAKPSTTFDSSTGALSAPAGCLCESVPAPSEYDYFPSPVLDSVTSTDPTGDVGEGGGTVVVVRGRGFDIFALTAAVLGDPTKADAYFTDVTPVSPTELDVTIPARPGDLTVDEVTAALQIETMASPNAGDLTSSDPDHQPSNAVTVTYAGLPKVRAISARLGPVTGGTGITLSGKGLRPTGMAVFASIPTSSMEVGFMSTAQTMIATSTSAATFLAPPSLPGPTSVMACTVTGCSDPKDSVSFAYYPLGEASITGLSRTHSTAKGGDLLEITGENLACALEVRFRGVAKVTPRLVPSLTGCGGSTSLKVRVPAAWKGASAQVQVLTAEGVGEGSGYSPSEQGFTYTWGR